jgi:hypothetical protein
MSQLTLPAVSLAAAVLGVASHLGYFNHGEHHWDSFRLLCLFTISPIILFVSFAGFRQEHSYFRAASLTTVATSSYLAAINFFYELFHSH